MADTCEACGSEYTKKRSDQRFCRRQCSQRYVMMHNPRGCDEPDCDKPHRAKGYCHNHYRLKYGRGGGERATYPCAVCGTPIERHNSGPARRARQLPTCSNRCRNIVGRGWRTDLPDDHPARWYGHSMAVTYTHCKFCHILFAHDARWSRTYCSSHSAGSRPRFVSASCHDCGTPVTLDRHVLQNASDAGYVYCGKRCRTRAGRRRRRAREYSAPGEYRWVDVIGLWLALGKRCAYCGVQSDRQPDPDHVVPLSRHGDNTIDNILPACRACNSDKQAMTLDEWASWRATKRKPALPHPWRAMGWRRIEQVPGDLSLWHACSTAAG